MYKCIFTYVRTYIHACITFFDNDDCFSSSVASLIFLFPYSILETAVLFPPSHINWWLVMAEYFLNLSQVNVMRHLGFYWLLMYHCHCFVSFSKQKFSPYYWKGSYSISSLVLTLPTVFAYMFETLIFFKTVIFLYSLPKQGWCPCILKFRTQMLYLILGSPPVSDGPSPSNINIDHRNMSFEFYKYVYRLYFICQIQLFIIFVSVRQACKSWLTALLLGGPHLQDSF